MKRHPRGPFERIRWFCNDGTVLPPGEGACRDHGGGIQHGEWNTRTLAIRGQGYLIATLLADIKALDFIGPAPRLDDLRQVLLEQFLIQNDDGWVFRQARFYRGALQVEDERVGARSLLLTLIEDADWRDPTRYLLLREAARLLPVSAEPPAAVTVRQLAVEIADQDPGFRDLRVKLHGIPDARDPQRVRDYAATRGLPALTETYAHLAAELDALYAPQTALHQLEQLVTESGSRLLKDTLRAGITQLHTARDIQTRLRITADLAVQWRALLATTTALSPPNRLRLLQAGLSLEQEAYAVGNQLLEAAPDADRHTQLQWLRGLGMSLFASGLLSERQLDALGRQIDLLEQATVLDAETYFAGLRQLARIPQWAQRALEFQFAPTVRLWTDLTPQAVLFIPDRLRGSPLLTYTRILDALLQDASRLAGVKHTLFGQATASGLRALNPGLRRGVLLAPPEAAEAFRKDGIYLLPSTTPELPPVAGILTLGEGSSLSHVQLLARNLGIPNVVVDEGLLPQISDRLGTRIVLAVSPRGTVRIAADGPDWDAVFGNEALGEDVVIEPDLSKLDLKTTDLRPLRELRATDSGRSIGPKAANLGELRHHYPQAVNPGVVIPFGVFRALLDRPIEQGGPAAFDWLRAEYDRLRDIADPAQRHVETRHVLEQLRAWITHTDPGEAFRAELRAALEKTFGDIETVGVFVRSDTNVEDLPGFTGAGLNLTVPNAVGFEVIVQAIQHVWASPFTERAYAWRQMHMPQPEHVYPAVLLLQTFPSEKSGVLVTTDVETGDRHWLTIATSEGVGGAVDGQAAEELRVRRAGGEVRLLAQASAPLRAEPAPEGGMRRRPASGRDSLLLPAEIEQLRRLADDVERRFPMPVGADGLPAPADIEFGFRDGRLALFQIRPFVESPRARRSLYLIEMDRAAASGEATPVDLRQPPVPETP
ncbi:MAG: PEP/pyruvate-binding domain-containing protein [Gammaproteobacteria bacterium]